MAGVDRTDRALLPRGQERAAPFSLATMLRTLLLQQWFTLSDPAMEKAFFDCLCTGKRATIGTLS